MIHSHPGESHSQLAEFSEAVTQEQEACWGWELGMQACGERPGSDPGRGICLPAGPGCSAQGSARDGVSV